MNKRSLIFSLALAITICHNLISQTASINVEGTRVFMIPPDGFMRGENFIGFQKGEEALIQVMDLAGGSFASNARSFSLEGFKAKGLTPLEFKELTVDGYKARFAVLKRDSEVTSLNLVFGDDSFSVMLIGFIQGTNESLEKNIKAAMLSATYKKDLEVDPFASTFFSIDDSNSELKFAQSNASMFMYTIGGATDNIQEQPFLMIIPVPFDQSSKPKESAQSMIASLKEKGYSDVKTISSSSEKINGYVAYETLSSGNMAGKPVNLFITVITKGENQLIIQAMHPGTDFDPKPFRNLINTVKMR